MKRRQEFSKPTLNEVLKKAIEKQAIQKEKDRQRANMSIYELFADPSSELSDDNYSNVQRYMSELLKVQDTNVMLCNNFVKKFKVYYKNAKTEMNIPSDGSEVSYISRRSRPTRR